MSPGSTRRRDVAILREQFSRTDTVWQHHSLPLRPGLSCLESRLYIFWIKLGVIGKNHIISLPFRDWRNILIPMGTMYIMFRSFKKRHQISPSLREKKWGPHLIKKLEFCFAQCKDTSVVMTAHQYVRWDVWDPLYPPQHHAQHTVRVWLKYDVKNNHTIHGMHANLSIGQRQGGTLVHSYQ